MSARVGLGALWVATVIGAAAAGAFFAREDARPTSAARSTEDGASGRRDLPAAHESLSASDVRAILRSENERMRATESRATPETARGEHNEGRTRERLAATEEARVIVSAAVSRGQWTVSDRDRLRRHIGALDAAERDALLTALTAAINRGDVRLERAMPVL